MILWFTQRSVGELFPMTTWYFPSEHQGSFNGIGTRFFMLFYPHSRAAYAIAIIHHVVFTVRRTSVLWPPRRSCRFDITPFT